MRTIAYRVLGPGWGIAIDLTAASAPVAAPPVGGDRISARIWLDTGPVLNHPPSDRSGLRLTPDEVGWLRRGLGAVAAETEGILPPRVLTLLTVHRVLFPEAGFQAEGLAGAMMAWCREEFGLGPEPVGTVSFDRAANRFLYGWEEHHPGRRAAHVRTVQPTRDLLGRPLPPHLRPRPGG
ncbi:hypothetical protein [Streptomyces sp. NPDC055287]